MKHRSTQAGRRVGWKWAALVLLLLAWGCGGANQSSGCSCAKPIPGGFPAKYKAPNMTQIKVTQAGFQFVEKNAGALLGTLLPGGLSFDVPPTTSGSIKVCTNPPCKVNATVRNLKIGMAPPKSLKVDLWLDIASSPIKISLKGLIFTHKCDVRLTAKNKHISTRVTLGIDPRNQGLTFNLGNPNVSVATSDFKISGGVVCSIANLLRGLFKGMLESEVKKALGGLTDNLACMKCKQSSECPSGSTCSKEKCMQGGSCLPMEVGFSGAVSLTNLLGGLGNPTAKDLWFGLNIGGRADVKTDGLELGMLGGTHAEPHPCVSPRTFPPIKAAANFAFPLNAPDGKPYGIGAAVSQAMLTRAARSLYTNGGLCIRIDSSISKELGGAFSVKNLGSLISPSLPKIVGKGDAPLVIALRPSEPADISIGEGTFTKDAKGNQVVKEPLIDLKIPNLYFDFLVLLHDRWTRLFSYKVDLALPIGLAVKPGNKLGLVMGDLGTAMSNPRVENSFLVTEDNAKLANGLFNLLKAVLPLATGALGNQEFELPDLQGIKLTVRGITGQTPRADRSGRFEYLALFADLGAGSPNKPLLPKMPIGLKLVQVKIPPGLRGELAARKRVRQFPAAVFEIQDLRQDREYSFRLNSSMWSPYRSGHRIVFENPQLLIQGAHKLEVRSRSRTYPGSEDRGFGSLRFKVDFTPPEVSLRPVASGLLPTVLDNLSALPAIKVEYRINGTQWMRLMPGDSIPTQRLSKGDRLEIQATDGQGNVRRQSLSWSPKSLQKLAKAQPKSLQNNAPATPAPRPGTMGCSQWSQEPSGPGLAWALWLLLLGFGWRLRASDR